MRKEYHEGHYLSTDEDQSLDPSPGSSTVPSVVLVSYFVQVTENCGCIPLNVMLLV